MVQPIYFSKVEFRETIGYGKAESIILLNLVEQELSYQVFRWKYQQMSGIEGSKTEEYLAGEKTHSYRFHNPVCWLGSEKTEFRPKLIQIEDYEQDVIFSYGIKLTDRQMGEILPLCNANDYEPFRTDR